MEGVFGMTLSLNRTKLNGKNFLVHILKYGFFAEQFPNCFSTKQLVEHVDELIPLVSTTKKTGSKAATSPTTLSMFKNDISRRVLSVPNPEAFIRLSKYIDEHWEEIKRYAHSNNSLSPITFLYNDYGELESLINCESIRESLHVRSDFIKGIHRSILKSLGFRYRLKVDITNCYNSMYTHSIAWAICGKEQAKSYLRTKEPQNIKSDYEIADTLDCFTRYLKNNETNGIIVGPYTSRIISEIILARIDALLEEKGFIFVRYVDDYKFYFRTETHAQDSLSIIEKVLNEYDLSLNTSKTEIQKYPYEIIYDIKDQYVKALDNGGVFGVLNMASQLHAAGEKGAYKYALKYLRGKDLPEKKELNIVIPTLINIMLLDPKYGKYVTEYLIENIDGIDEGGLTRVFNTELSKSVESELQQETLLFIQLIRDLNLEIDGDNLLRVINGDNDFATIIALDLWKNRNRKVIRSKSVAGSIKKAIERLMNSLQGEKLSGARWLLLYEIMAHKLVSESLMPTIECSEFFRKMLSLKVSFYQSVRNGY
jgi:hypothetical protein